MAQDFLPFKSVDWNEVNPEKSLVSVVSTPFYLQLHVLEDNYAVIRVEEYTKKKEQIEIAEFLNAKAKVTVLKESMVRKQCSYDKSARHRVTHATKIAAWKALGMSDVVGQVDSKECLQTPDDVTIDEITLPTLVHLIKGTSTSKVSSYYTLMKNEKDSFDEVFYKFSKKPTADLKEIFSDTEGQKNQSPSEKPRPTTYKLYADILRRRKNIVLEGPPGTGKTHAIKGIVKALETEGARLIGGRGKGEFAITMHPATSYEDFIEGLRPAREGSFTFQPGVFTEIIRKAIQEPDKDHVVLLDELNRSNVPRVMGDLLTTLEASKRTKQKEQIEESGLLGENEKMLSYVTFSEVVRNGANTTSFRHTVSKDWKNIVQNEHGQFRYYRNKIDHEPHLKVVESADLARTRKKNEFAGNLGFTHPIRSDGVKLGVAFLVINKILYPIISEDWVNRLFDKSLESPDTMMRVWSPEGVLCVKVLENSETKMVYNAPYGTIKVIRDQHTCTKDTESEHYYWSEGCDSLWANDRRVEVKLSGSKKRLHVPENLLVIGTMNTTDRSVAPLDAALRRRFVFLRVDPDESITASILCDEAGGKITDEGKTRLENSLKIWKKVNKLLRIHLGQDATIGHSYFFDLARELIDVSKPSHARHLERQAWKYAVLPQVADLLDSTGRANKLLADEGGLKNLNKHIEDLGLELSAGEGTNRMYARTMVVETGGNGVTKDGVGNESGADNEGGADTEAIDQ